jgi:quinol monooxygenase YgiN
MVRINAFLLIENSENKQQVIDAATELVELSLHDKGCIAYDLFSSETVDNHLMICETWATKADLEAHSKSEHFKRIVPQLQQLATLTLEHFDF